MEELTINGINLLENVDVCISIQNIKRIRNQNI